MSIRSDKLIIGPRLCRFRKTLGLTQTRMAEDLGISPSYLTLMESNQRAMSANVLLRMAERYDFDISSFTGQSDAHLVAEIYETLRTPMFKEMPVSKSEAEELVAASPNAAKAFLKMYNKQRDLAMRGDELASDRDRVELLEQSAEAVESVRHFFQAERNYFPELDAVAQEFSEIGRAHV